MWIYLNFDKKYLQNLKYNVKKAYMNFSFNFGWYSILLLSVKNMFFFKEHLLRTVNREVGGFLLNANEQNLLKHDKCYLSTVLRLVSSWSAKYSTSEYLIARHKYH